MDSWEDMGGSTDVFTIRNDWDAQPTQGLDPFRTVIQAPGTGINLRNITDDVQISFTMHFCQKDKNDENTLLNFFNSHRGRANAFWFPIPRNYWTLNTDTDPGTPNFLVLDNTDPQWLHGWERMFVLLKNGDYIGRQIASIATPGGSGLPNLMTVVTALDRVVKVQDVETFGRLLLCRFDQDELELKHVTTAQSEVDIAFKEWPKEYPI